MDDLPWALVWMTGLVCAAAIIIVGMLIEEGVL